MLDLRNVFAGIFYVSLVARKIKLFVGHPNFQLNTYISVLLCSYFLTYHQIFFNFVGINQDWVCV